MALYCEHPTAAAEAKRMILERRNWEGATAPDCRDGDGARLSFPLGIRQNSPGAGETLYRSDA